MGGGENWGTGSSLSARVGRAAGEGAEVRGDGGGLHDPTLPLSSSRGHL